MRRKDTFAMMSEMANPDADDEYYTLVPEQGLCLVGDDIVNLKTVSLIRRADGKTLVYCPGLAAPVELPLRAFDQIRDAVFAADDVDDDDDFDDEEEE